MKQYKINLAGFSDLFERSRFLVYCSLNVFNLLKALGILSSFPSPQVSVYPRHASPSGFSGSCPFLHLCQDKVQHWANPPGSSQRRRLWKPTGPCCCPLLWFPSVATAAAPTPPCLLFFLSDPQHQCPSEPLGTEVCPLHWPRLPTPEHPSVNGKQQDLSASPFSSGL